LDVGKEIKQSINEKRTEDMGQVCGENIEMDGQQKKIPDLRLTKGNHADFFGILFTRAEDGILALLAHPGDQEFLLRKLTVKSLNFIATVHAYVRFHLRDPVREQYVCRSFLDV